jgi:hypothetical protein
LRKDPGNPASVGRDSLVLAQIMGADEAVKVVLVEVTEGDPGSLEEAGHTAEAGKR